MLIQFITLINLLVPDVLLRKLMQQIIIKTRNKVLLVTLRIPRGWAIDFFCFNLQVEGSYGG